MAAKPHFFSFGYQGSLVPNYKNRKKRLEGWLTTYGHLGPDGAIHPTKDRDDQVFEAAAALGRIDWSNYLKKGRWNDTHREHIVGLPAGLEFHDRNTERAQKERKIGFWTWGHLFDRNDPDSWQALGRKPTDHEFRRADHFWEMANDLQDLPRSLGLSADGRMALSPCRKRILAAQIDAAAVCEVPRNPDATLVLAKGGPDILSTLRSSMVGASPCSRCCCPTGQRCQDFGLKKAVVDASGLVPFDLSPLGALDPTREWAKLIDGINPSDDQDLVVALQMRYLLSESDARHLLRVLRRQENA